MRLLHDIVAAYTRRDDYSAGYCDQLRWCVNAFSRQLERPATIDDLTEETLSDFLRSGRGKWRDETRRGRKRMLLTIWRAAADQGLVDQPNTRQIVRVPMRDRIPQAWTVDQVRQLLAATHGLDGACGKIPARLYWASYVLAAWDTGLRGCDLRDLERDWIPPHGRLTIVQRKTGKRVILRLRETTLAAIDATFPPARRRIWPLWGRIEVWRRSARQLVKAAGLSGSIGRLRHSSGTAVEAEHPGCGHQHLGNSQAVFREYYFDAAATAAEKPLPPALG